MTPRTSPHKKASLLVGEEWVLGCVVLTLVGLTVWMNQPTPEVVLQVTPVISKRQSWLPPVPETFSEVSSPVYAKAIAVQTIQTADTSPHFPKKLTRFAKKALPPLASVDINRASPQQLEALPQVGPKLAQRIVAYRKQHGPFTSIEALDSVKGIGPKLLHKMRPYLKPFS